MKFGRKKLEPMPARCGRCAELLPDETLSFCPSCGVPFSRVLPTESFVSLAERKFQLDDQRRRLKSSAIAMLALWAVVGATYISSDVLRQSEIADIKSQRKIVIYCYDFKNFPALRNEDRRQALAVATQAFQDHFGVALQHIEIREDALPAEMLKMSQGEWKKEYETLSYWERELLPIFAKRSGYFLENDLPVIVSNLPIWVDEQNGGMETRHLSPSGLLSGLGSPAFVLVSSFRLLTTQKNLLATKPELSQPADKARYLGEYLLAHEWGHALLGLPDVVWSAREKLPASGGIRAPASLPTVRAAPPAECLMHTDEGGGQLAWQNLKKRPLGNPSQCGEYDDSLNIWELRRQSIALLKAGQRAEAESLHLSALQQARLQANAWVFEYLKHEHTSFLTVWDRWRKKKVVFESRHGRI